MQLHVVVTAVEQRKVRVTNDATGQSDMKDAWVIDCRGVHNKGMSVRITSETQQEILKYSKGKAYTLEL